MKTLTELAFECDPIYAMTRDPKTLYEYTKDQYIKVYELDDSRIKPFYLVDENKWKVKLPTTDEGNVEDFATGRKIFINGNLVHYGYIYHLDHNFFCPFTLEEETKIQESGGIYEYTIE